MGHNFGGRGQPPEAPGPRQVTPRMPDPVAAAERLRRLEIDDQLDLPRLLDGQIGASGTLADMACAYSLTAVPQESC